MSSDKKNTPDVQNVFDSLNDRSMDLTDIKNTLQLCSFAYSNSSNHNEIYFLQGAIHLLVEKVESTEAAMDNALDDLRKLINTGKI